MSGNQALTTQVGGNHYSTMKYQPIQFAMDAQLNPVQFSIVKYVSRYKNKNGLQDLQKALHFCEIGAEIDTVAIGDDIHWQNTLLNRYVHENKLSVMHDVIISHASVKQYSYAADKIRKLIAESDQ